MREIDRKLEEEARSPTTSSKRLEELAFQNGYLAEIVASNTATPLELLKKLARLVHLPNIKAINRAIVRNPSLPLNVLIYAAQLYPQECLENPILDLLYLENPDFLNQFHDKLMILLLQQNNVPQFILDFAAEHNNEEVVAAANQSIHLSGEMTEGWHEAAEVAIKNLDAVRDFMTPHYQGNRIKILSQNMPELDRI